jgi:hypothetical protein
MPLRRCLPILLLLSVPLSVRAADIIIVTIDDDKANVEIHLDGPGGIVYDADMELEFHAPLNLSEACLGISADVLDAAEIADIESRLPDPINQGIDPAFPVRITVDPPAACGLEFEDEVHVEIDTPELVWVAFSPYRLMKAPIGGAFRDITALVEPGSVRARGSGGSFSEFVVVEDLEQDYVAEATAAYAGLDALIGDGRLATTAAQTLAADAASSRAAFEATDPLTASARLLELVEHGAVLGGEALPNRWRATRDLDNLEGEIVSQAEHLRFLLGRLNGSP